MDLTAATVLNDYALPKPLEIICYHAQQYTEKMLKGFILASGGDPPKKHDLPLLCDICAEVDARFERLRDICDFLTLFGVQPRYPHELEVLESDAERAIQSAKTVVSFFTENGISIERDDGSVSGNGNE